MRGAEPPTGGAVDPWWVIAESSVLAALRRVAAGESPDLVYAEMYANAEHEPCR